MSGQDVGFFDVGTDCPDLVIENGDLKADNGLETAALISLFSDRRVSFEELPLGEDDQMGWWADLISDVEGDKIGSRYWIIERLGKVSNATAVEIESVFKQAFDWMLEDGIAAKIVVDAVRNPNTPNEITGSVDIIKPDGDNIPFGFVWNGQRLKLLDNTE